MSETKDMPKNPTRNVTFPQNSNVELPQTEKRGLITTWVDLGMEMTEVTIKASFGLMEDLRKESSDRVASTVSYFDEMGQGFFRVGKKVQGRIDQVLGSAIQNSERAALSLCGAVRKTAGATTQMVSTTTRSMFEAPAATDQPN